MILGKTYLNGIINDLYLGNTLIYSGVNTDFIMSVKTDNVGTSADNQFTLPLISSFNGVTANVDWGDGTSDAITAFNQVEVTHTYPSAGNYTIKISNALRGWQFVDGGDKLKAGNISNWGVFEANEPQGFRGCSNLTSSATDCPSVTTSNFGAYFLDCTSFNETLRDLDLSGVTNIANTFRNTTSLVDLDASIWDVSSFDYVREGFKNSASNPDVTNWNTSSITNAVWLFQDCDNFDRNMAAWDISSVTDFTQFMTGSAGLSTTNYDATLIGWAYGNGGLNPLPNTGLACHFGGSINTLGGAAEAAKNVLIDTYLWTITDGLS